MRAKRRKLQLNVQHVLRKLVCYEILCKCFSFRETFRLAPRSKRAKKQVEEEEEEEEEVEEEVEEEEKAEVILFKCRFVNRSIDRLGRRSCSVIKIRYY